MSDSDKMRADFEAWAEDYNLGRTLAATSATGFYTRNIAWTAWQVAHAAGQKAERAAIFIEWENGEIMAAEVERLRAACNKYSEDELLQGDWKARALKAETELAAAKADLASLDAIVAENEFLRVADGQLLADWLRERVKERGEQ
tara:strand:- start:357 stop:791 length:435 start_codon:yes stop_codon:yes gene_type:complete